MAKPPGDKENALRAMREARFTGRITKSEVPDVSQVPATKPRKKAAPKPLKADDDVSG